MDAISHSWIVHASGMQKTWHARTNVLSHWTIEIFYEVANVEIVTYKDISS